MDLNSSIPQACTSLNAKLEQLSGVQSECTIYRVHTHLRNVNPSAYEPEVIAIGPYHHGKDELKMMEDYKLRNLQLLIERKGCDVERYAAAVGGLESKARKCYADQNFNLSESQFIEMLVLDGCFIVELVRKLHGSFHQENNDPIFEMTWMVISLQHDLMLFENQVPFFVLHELFDLIKDPNENCTLLHLLSNFFSDFCPGKGRREVVNVAPHEIMHLLDFIHRSWLPPSSTLRSTRKENRGFQFINCATGLTEANVRFEKMKEEATLFDIEFKEGVMVMAPLRIEDWTECFLRNLIAYEQYFHRCPNNFVTDYMKLLDSLINSAKDVEILSRNDIITNWQGDDEVVAKMVNGLGVWVACCGKCFNYDQIFEDVNEQCRKPWNKWMAKLRRNYLHSPWAIISIMVAVLLLLLTLTQTLFTILQVVAYN